MAIFTVFSRAALYRPITEFELGAEPFPHSNAEGTLRRMKSRKSTWYFLALREGNHPSMSTEEAFVQQLARLFVHHRDALTLDTVREDCRQLPSLNEMPAVELDRMISAVRLALLEIENNAREQDDTRHYYSRADRTIG